MAEAIVLEDTLKRWSNLWETGWIRWHRTEPNRILVKSYNTLTSGRHDLTFLVPLCGKSVDLAWLYHRGNNVIGIEGVEKAVRDFFKENNLEHTVEKMDVGLLFQTLDKRLHVYCTDFFKLSSNIIGQVDCVWDRGSLVAMMKENRQKYVAMMKSYLKPGFQYLLEVIEYDVPLHPDIWPKSVSCEEVKQLYGVFCNVTHLESSDRDPKTTPQITGAAWIKAHDFLLTEKRSN